MYLANNHHQMGFMHWDFFMNRFIVFLHASCAIFSYIYTYAQVCVCVWPSAT
jgi:hypothetical protein